jgi:hypothetical protein
MASDIHTKMSSSFCVSIAWKNPKNRIHMLKDGSNGIRIRSEELTKVKLVAEDFIPSLFMEQYTKEEQQARERKEKIMTKKTQVTHGVFGPAVVYYRYCDCRRRPLEKKISVQLVHKIIFSRIVFARNHIMFSIFSKLSSAFSNISLFS